MVCGIGMQAFGMACVAISPLLRREESVIMVNLYMWPCQVSPLCFFFLNNNPWPDLSGRGDYLQFAVY